MTGRSLDGVQSYTTHGTVTDPAFEKLRAVFESNFADGLESGASFAVYHRGRLVISLWGGVANSRHSTEWTENTLTVLFSATKSLAATALSYSLQTWGRAKGLDWDTTVAASIWPAFGAHGKERITLRQILHHQAGLLYSQEEVTPDHVRDPSKMAAYFERMTPVFPPGSAVGYHALTFGFLVDQLIRHIHPEGRGVVDVLNEHIILPFGIDDLFIGSEDESVLSRVATVSDPERPHLRGDCTKEEKERADEAQRRWASGDNVHNENLYKTWSWIRTSDYNVDANRRLAMPSNMGLGSARSLAHFHSLLATNSLAPFDVDDLVRSGPQLVDHMDVANGYPETKGFGWQWSIPPGGTAATQFGHSGFGGQNVRVDRNRQLAFAYVTNALKQADADLVEPFHRLQRTLYEIIDNNID